MVVDYMYVYTPSMKHFQKVTNHTLADQLHACCVTRTLCQRHLSLLASSTCSFITACRSVIAAVVALCTSGPLTVYPLFFCILAWWRSMSTAVMAVYEHANSAPRERKLKRKQQKACYFRLKTIALHDSASGGECLRTEMNTLLSLCATNHMVVKIGYFDQFTTQQRMDEC